MKSLVILLLITIICYSSYSQTKGYQPKDLRKLTENELLDRARKRIGYGESIVFKDSEGKVILQEKLAGINWNEWTTDVYVDNSNKVQELVLRKASSQDKKLSAMLQQAYDEGEPFTLLDIDCANSKNILGEVYKKDQSSRQNHNMGNEEVDRKNQQIVVSLIEKCGFPTSAQVGSNGIQAIFLVIQHASSSLREKYFPFIKASADKGELSWSTVALMEDRMLMDKGKKQKYGSQVTKKMGSDTWELYPIEDPDNVNKRRAAIGLGPLEEYLKHFQIEYSTERTKN